MPNFIQECDASDLPKAVTLPTCNFPIVEGNVDGYKVLTLPQELRKIFDEEDASVVRINSLTIAHAIPDYGGRGSGEHFSLLPHQDHSDPYNDPRRFLMLSKLTDGARGSSTLIMTPDVAATLLPLEEVWIKDDGRREMIGKERSYDPRFHITQEQYDCCFDEKGGYERVIASVAGHSRSRERVLTVRLGILGFLIRGSCADEVMRELVEKCQDQFLEERWDYGGIVIMDNRRVFHARLGGNSPPLQRNFCI